MAESSTKSDMITKVIDDIFASGSINATPIIIDRPKCTLGLFRIKNVVLILLGYSHYDYGGSKKIQ
jgi:hypothetical protein